MKVILIDNSTNVSEVIHLSSVPRKEDKIVWNEKRYTAEDIVWYMRSPSTNAKFETMEPYVEIYLNNQ